MTEITAAPGGGIEPGSGTGAKKEKRSPALTLILLAALVVLNIVAVRVYPPVKPVIRVVPESLLVGAGGEPAPWFTIPGVGPVYLTNTLMAVFLVFVILIGLSIVVRFRVKSAVRRPSGLILYLETTMDMLTGMVKGSIDPKWSGRILPFYFTFFFYVLLANLTKVLPFFETVGVAVPADGGLAAERWTPWLYAVTNRIAGEGAQGYELVSFFRGASTSLNFTLSLAIGSVLMIQAFGVRANGWRYFTKFLPLGYIAMLGRLIGAGLQAGIAKLILLVRGGGPPKSGEGFLAKADGTALKMEMELFRKKAGGFFIDTFVGVLELVSEAAKILSFAFRLFGNMFAGSVLLLFLGYMVPVVLTSFLQLYEMIFGLIQAFVFGMLTAIFMNMAVQHEKE